MLFKDVEIGSDCFYYGVKIVKIHEIEYEGFKYNYFNPENRRVSFLNYNSAVEKFDMVGDIMTWEEYQSKHYDAFVVAHYEKVIGVFSKYEDAKKHSKKDVNYKLTSCKMDNLL